MWPGIRAVGGPPDHSKAGGSVPGARFGSRGLCIRPIVARESGVVGLAHANRDDGDALGKRLVEYLLGAPSALGGRLLLWVCLFHG